MRRTAIALAAGFATVSAVILGAPPASAEANPPGCGKGYFCIYSGLGQTGSVVLRTAGNWSGRVTGKSVFNNGYRYPGADHIQLSDVWQGKNFSQCFHYNPGPGEYKSDFEDGVVFTKVVWRGEC